MVVPVPIDRAMLDLVPLALIDRVALIDLLDRLLDQGFRKLVQQILQIEMLDLSPNRQLGLSHSQAWAAWVAWAAWAAWAA